MKRAIFCFRCPVSGSNSCSVSTSSSNSETRIAFSAFSAGKMSSTSPRTRNTPRLKSTSLRAYCISVSRLIASRCDMRVALLQVQDHAVVLGRVADAVDRRHRRDDHAIGPLEDRLGRRQPHLLDVLVDRAVLLDVEVARRDVGLRLVVVVVRDEVLDRVVREELAELRIELRRQRLVGRDHDRRPPGARDDVGHRERLARARHAQQRLERQAVVSGPRPASRSPPAGRRPARTAGAVRRGCPEETVHGSAASEGPVIVRRVCVARSGRRRAWRLTSGQT